MTRIFVLLAISLISTQAMPEARTIFAGVPIVKIVEGGTQRAAAEVSRSEAVKWECIISEIDGKYYWASRENKELTQRTSGAFTTYFASDGSGYVRVLDPDEKQLASAMSSTEAEFEYVEHLLIGLQSVTYYGHSR